MSEYYVDARTREVVCKEQLDLNMLAPELYYEYRCGVLDGVITETWYCGNDEVLDFCTTINNPYKDKERSMHFKRHGASPLYLLAYTVPPKWYEEMTVEARNRTLSDK